jgi:hypothetical protein
MRGVQNSEGGWPKMAIFARGGHYPWMILAFKPFLLSARLIADRIVAVQILDCSTCKQQLPE